MNTMPNILCCLCGISIQSNPTNMCTNCMKSQVDLSVGISKQLTVLWYRGCGRYNRMQWIVAERESRELLAFLLKKIKGLGRETKVVDADFVYTEPHSMRLKVRLTVQKEVYVGAILQQQFIVEYVVQPVQCPDCARSYTEHQWDTVVQVRQKVRHKRTFFFLEQLLLKHNVCMKCISIKEEAQGLDFHWGSRQDAHVLSNYLQTVLPVRMQEAKRLISHNEKEGTAHFKFTFMVEIVPLCKYDVVLLSKTISQMFGGVVGPLLVYKVSSLIHFIDPFTLRTYEMSAMHYWRDPFGSILNSSQLTEFTVLDIEMEQEVKQRAGQQQRRGGHGGSDFDCKQFGHNKMSLAEVEIARAADFGINDDTSRCVTHLGNVLKVGDSCMGYLVSTANINSDIELPRGFKLPEVILVKKHFANRKQSRAAKRKFKLKELIKESDDNKKRAQNEQDYEEFMQEVEEDPELRAQITLYKADSTVKKKAAQSQGKDADVAMNSDEDDGFPDIPMEELLDEMANLKPVDASEPADTDD